MKDNQAKVKKELDEKVASAKTVVENARTEAQSIIRLAQASADIIKKCASVNRSIGTRRSEYRAKRAAKRKLLRNKRNDIKK